MTWRELIAAAEARVGASDARRLAARASGYGVGELVLHRDEVVTPRVESFFAAMVDRRKAGEPLQYVLGHWGFRHLELFVDPRVLIPRPETETVVDVALAELAGLRLDRPPTVLDLGTGSGAIALALATEVPGATVWAVDRSPDALAVARANVAGVGGYAATRVRLVEGSWFEPLPAGLQFDLVVANPPYVAESDELPAEVADWEPTGALIAGPDGTEDIFAILDTAPDFVARPGVLVIEIAPHQATAVTARAEVAGFAGVRVDPDLTGRPRALVAHHTHNPAPQPAPPSESGVESG